MVGATLKLPNRYFFSFLTLISLAMQQQYALLGRSKQN
ncbi:MAG: hypothetical protein ACI9TB_002118, partial [Parasphingorhabdus sp.]